ncbi:MAG: hypothetical protein M3Y33_13785 [Actinomycetota bacterium]|nr:hypothetical protein [Actinomycetota bacterium]
MAAIDEEKGPVAFNALPLPARTWHTAARLRPAYFSALPAGEIAELERAAPGSPAAVLYGQTIHLPGHRGLATAAGREVFVRCGTRFDNRDRDRHCHYR